MKLSLDQSIFKKYAEKKRDILLISGASLIFFLWFFSYYSHNQDLIARCHYEVKNLETQQSTLVKTKTLQTKLETNIDSLKLRLRNTEKATPVVNAKKPTTHMTDLANKACKTGLRLDSCTILKQKNKAWFTQQNIVYEVTGSDEQITKFIKEIQQSEHLVRCTNLALKKIDPTTSHLACTLQFLIFKNKISCTTPASTPMTPTTPAAHT